MHARLVRKNKTKGFGLNEFVALSISVAQVGHKNLLETRDPRPECGMSPKTRAQGPPKKTFVTILSVSHFLSILDLFCGGKKSEDIAM